MNPQLAKEFRPLLLPWSVAAVAAAGYLVGGADPLFAKGEFGPFLSGLAGTGFFVGCLILTAMPLGFELHAHTLGLLLSQPTDRARLWKNKLLVAAVALLALGIVHGLASGVAGQLRWEESLACLAFMAAAVCSVGYWTLATGSVLVGIACAVSLPIGIAASIHVVVYEFLGIEVQVSEQTALVLGAALCIGYCAFFLWLGQRQFVGIELKAGVVGRMAEIPQALIPRQLTELFRCRPAGAITNLIRKEACLQRPIFLVSAIFTVGWLVTLLSMVLRPAWHDACLAVFNGLTGTQVTLMAILAGCVSLGDDTALGTKACHLTLPVSTRRQWFIKLFVAGATFVVVAIILPTLLATLTLFKARVGLLAIRQGNICALAIPCALAFAVSFWSASMVVNTVRAAMTCMVALFGAIGCLLLGTAMPLSFFAPSSDYIGLQSGLFTGILAHNQLPPDHFLHHDGVGAYSVLLICLVFMSVMLVQSLRLFRRLQTKPIIKVKYAAVLVAIAIGGSFWCADLMQSILSPWKRFNLEVGQALASLPREKLSSANDTWSITPQELEQTGKLTRTTSDWLRNSEIRFTKLRPASPKTAVQLTISFTFPKGDLYQAPYPGDFGR